MNCYNICDYRGNLSFSSSGITILWGYLYFFNSSYIPSFAMMFIRLHFAFYYIFLLFYKWCFSTAILSLSMVLIENSSFLSFFSWSTFSFLVGNYSPTYYSLSPIVGVLILFPLSPLLRSGGWISYMDIMDLFALGLCIEGNAFGRQ